MKNMLKRLLLAAAIFALPSCTAFYAGNQEYGRRVSTILPKPDDSPAKAELKYQYAEVYRYCVHLRSKSGATRPIEIWVDDVTKNGRFDAVYVRSGGPDTWRVYNAPITEPGISKIPDSLSRDEAHKYFALAVKAKAQLQKKVSHQPRLGIRTAPNKSRSAAKQQAKPKVQPVRQERDEPARTPAPKGRHPLEIDGWRRSPNNLGLEIWEKSA